MKKLTITCSTSSAANDYNPPNTQLYRQNIAATLLLDKASYSLKITRRVRHNGNSQWM